MNDSLYFRDEHLEVREMVRRFVQRDGRRLNRLTIRCVQRRFEIVER